MLKPVVVAASLLCAYTHDATTLALAAIMPTELTLGVVPTSADTSA
jgi:hypothetical protein